MRVENGEAILFYPHLAIRSNPLYTVLSWLWWH